MSRVGKKPIDIPRNVKVTVENGKVLVEGSKGRLERKIPDGISVDTKDSRVIVSRASDKKEFRSLHGLMRTLIFNMMKGVTEGYSKELEIVGVGFRGQVQGKTLTLNLGFSHPIAYHIPEGIVIETPKPTLISVKGINREKVGEVAARLRDYYRPEPYKGKGIRYAGEYVRRKAGKTVGGSA
jgi:large subunit ribosomal protein L6